MNPLLKKEIRLLLPAWALTMLLAVVPTWLFRSGRMGWSEFDHFAPVLFGILILCASSFGREFSLGTFSTLLAQPFSRKQFWFLKVGVLVAALMSVLGVYVFCAGVFQVTSVGDGDPSLVMVGGFLLAAIAGGLWLALLIRQMMAVIWLIVLVPFLLCLPCLLILSHYDAADKTVKTTLDLVLLAYAATGIAGSWLIFRGAQDAPWSGGTIVLPEWMSTRIALSPAAVKSRQGSLWSLVRKEFHFNQVTLLGMGVLFLLELGVIGLRYLHRNSPDIFWRDLNFALEAFGSVWIIAPLVVGCTSVAEERRLGTMEGQLCQPASIVRQFWVKLGFTLVVGGLLSSALFLLGEYLAAVIGLKTFYSGLAFVMSGGLCAVAVIAFFASSLTRNLLQALSVAVGTGLGIALIMKLFTTTSGFHLNSMQRALWNPILPQFIFTGLLAIALPWLACRNFRRLPELPRMWWRNGLGMVWLALSAAVISNAIYNRIWERFTPMEPAHGSARWTLNQAPIGLRAGFNGNNLLFQLPDGRFWYGWMGPWMPGFDENPGPKKAAYTPSLAGTWVFGGSNWVSLAMGSVDIHLSPTNTTKSGLPRPMIYERGIKNSEIAGIQANGTLWVSARPSSSGGNSLSSEWNTNALVRFGTETNWQDVATLPDSCVGLLKKDGTLWRWGDSSHNDLLTVAPVQIGTNDDWQQFSAFGWAVKKKDGSVWILRFNSKTHVAEIPRKLKFDPSRLKLESGDDTKHVLGTGVVRGASIRPDGTLWIGFLTSDKELQLGRETNWVSVSLGYNTGVVALKSDGTLWQWGDGPIFNPKRDFAGGARPLGTHRDWVSLTQCPEGVVSLAADGSLWLWGGGIEMFSGDAQGVLLKPSEKPILLGNILAAN